MPLFEKANIKLFTTLPDFINSIPLYVGFLLLINQCSSKTGIKLQVAPCPCPEQLSEHPPAALGEGHQTPLPCLCQTQPALPSLTTLHTIPGSFCLRDLHSKAEKLPHHPAGSQRPQELRHFPQSCLILQPHCPVVTGSALDMHRQIYFGGPNPAQSPSPASGRRMHSGTGCIINQQQI